MLRERDRERREREREDERRRERESEMSLSPLSLSLSLSLLSLYSSLSSLCFLSEILCNPNMAKMPKKHLSNEPISRTLLSKCGCCII